MSGLRIPMVLVLVAGLGLVILGTLVVTDRPGLVVEYYANVHDWQGSPVFTAIGSPQLGGREEVKGVLVSQEIFSLRWQGWVEIDREGEYRFAVKADERAYLHVDNQSLVECEGDGTPCRVDGTLFLAPGIYALEAGVSQTGGRSRFELSWAPPGAGFERLTDGRLVAHRPVRLRLGIRRWIPGSWSPQGRWIGGGILCLTGLILIRLGCRRLLPPGRWPVQSARDWLLEPERTRALHALFLLVLFLVSALAVFPFTASTADGDDIRYMDGAFFNKKMGWTLNRYVHIYLLKGFIWLSEGDAFLASRVQWACMFGATVLAMAVAARSLGPGLQLRTLAVALFILLAQSSLFGGIGAAYADYTSMMFVTLGLAVYLHGYGPRASSESGWSAVILGVLTLAALKSKESGVILLWLALLLLWTGGRIDLRGFARRMAYWVTGVVAAYLLLMSLDAVFLNDFWFSLRWKSLEAFLDLTNVAVEKWQLSPLAWLDLAWRKGPQRTLSVLCLAAAVLAVVRTKRMELRLVALTPIVFVVMMMLVHPPIPLPRYFFPIIPLACFVGALSIHELGFSGAAWKGVLAPRTVVLVAALLVFLGSGAAHTRDALVRHRVYQRGELILYPWQAFQRVIEAERPRQIVVTPRLYRAYRMVGQRKTRDRIARLFFRRKHLRVRLRKELAPGTRLAIGDRRDFKRWCKTRPELKERAVFDRAGRLVLVRPR